MDIPYDLTCWYLNTRRIFELVGADSITNIFPANEAVDEHWQKMRMLSAQKSAVVSWLHQSNPAPLEKLITEGKLAPGQIFTHHSNFFFKGLSEVAKAIHSGKKPRLAQAYSKLEHWKPDGRLFFEFHHEHLTSESAWGALSQQKRMFVLGVIQEIVGSNIIILPYVVANIVSSDRGLGMAGAWGQYCEVHVDRINNFSKVSSYDKRLSKKSLDKLKNIPESAVKTALAEIINEPQIPKDWGGEKSDLISSYVTLEGRRITTAFAFKGPSKFKPMTMAELGKNGDQISRLFDEPAELFILQHCHEITPDVRKTMRAYAQQMGRPRLFCLIDGYDTLKILESYNKCGL